MIIQGNVYCLLRASYCAYLFHSSNYVKMDIIIIITMVLFSFLYINYVQCKRVYFSLSHLNHNFYFCCCNNYYLNSRRPAMLTEFLCGFHQPLQASAGVVP